MKVHIEDNIYLESDGIQFIIREYTGKFDEKGNEIYKNNQKFFSSVNSVLRYLLKMKIMKSTAKNLRELINEVEKLEQYLDEKIKI